MNGKASSAECSQAFFASDKRAASRSSSAASLAVSKPAKGVRSDVARVLAGSSKSLASRSSNSSSMSTALRAPRRPYVDDSDDTCKTLFHVFWSMFVHLSDALLLSCWNILAVACHNSVILVTLVSITFCLINDNTFVHLAGP